MANVNVMIDDDIKSECPNSKTLSAINEIEEMEKNPKKYKGYADIDSLMDDLVK